MKIWHCVAALSILVAGCSGEKETKKGGRSPESGRPLVYASNYPLKYFAERISAPPPGMESRPAFCRRRITSRTLKPDNCEK